MIKVTRRVYPLAPQIYAIKLILDQNFFLLACNSKHMISLTIETFSFEKIDSNYSKDYVDQKN